MYGGLSNPMCLPKISVITPSFNQAQFLEKTILSVLNQDYLNLEYIIIDGGSTDGSIEIIKKYNRLLTYWISEPDKGQSHAINKGFKIATGDYIGWINSDDELNDNTLNTLSKRILESQSKKEVKVLYYGMVELIDEESRFIKMHPFSDTLFFKSHLHKKSPVNQPGSFYQKNALDQVKYLNEDFHFCMDWDLWLKLLRVGEAQFINRVMARLRVHPKAKTYNNGNIAQIKESYEVFTTHCGSYFSMQFLKYMYYFGRYDLIKKLQRKDDSSRQFDVF